VGPLLLNVETLGPEAVVLVTRDVYEAAHAGMKKAGLPVIDVRLPFPSEGHALEFRQKLRQALVRAGLETLIRPLRRPAKPPSTVKAPAKSEVKGQAKLEAKARAKPDAKTPRRRPPE